MTSEEAILCLKGMKNYARDTFTEQTDWQTSLDMAIKALEMIEEFERAQIITGGRLNGRTYAYKCGLEDGKRKALEQESILDRDCEHCSKTYGTLGCCTTVSNKWVYSCKEGQREYLLDKIRAEIKEKYGDYDICEWFEDYDYEETNISEYQSVGDVSDILAIIDKYREESEGQVAYMLAEHNKLIGEHSKLKSKYGEILGEVETLRREPCGDVISRRKAICAVSACDGMSAQIEALEELPPVTPKQRWIPIGEKLPKIRQNVLCQCRANSYSVLRLNHDGDWECIYPHTIYMQSFVIAWMPLPQPYKAESEVSDADSN